MSAIERICFVIAPIGAPDSDTRRRSDQVLKHIIRPAVASRGYRAVRADEIAEPGLITSQVIQHVVDDPLVIADLTDRNPNVFYELALRHALRRPLVQIIQKGEQIPFDVAGMRTIPVDHHDLDSVEEAKADIAKQVEAVERPDAKIETPISVALELQSLRQSDNPEQRSLADLLAAVADLRSAVAAIEKRLADPEAVIPAALIQRLMKSDDMQQMQMAELRHFLGRLVHDFERDRAALDEFRMRQLREEPKGRPPKS